MKHGTVRLLRLATLLVFAGANHCVAQNRAAVARGDVARKSSRAFPKSCLVQEHPSEQISVLLETIRAHTTRSELYTLRTVASHAPSRHSKLRCAWTVRIGNRTITWASRF